MSRNIRAQIARLAVVTALLPLLLVLQAGEANAAYRWCGWTWVKSVYWQANGGYWKIVIDPTTRARLQGSAYLDAVWREVNTCVPAPMRTYPYANGTQSASAYMQLWCHAYFSGGAAGIYTGGDRWELETWRYPYVSLWSMTWHRCNW